MDSALPALDADLAWPNRKPQLQGEFDPRWAVSFHHGLGAGPYALAPYLTRGSIPPMLLGGSGKVQPTRRGWAYQGSAEGAADYYGVEGSTINWEINQTAGSLVYVFEALTDSGVTAASAQLLAHALIGDVSGADNNLQIYELIGTSIGDGGLIFNFGGAQSSLDMLGLWKAGDLVTLGMTWNGAVFHVYVQGSNEDANSASAGPASYSILATAVGASTNEISIGGDASATIATGIGRPVLAVTVSDRGYTDAEMAWIAANPLTWAFQPGAISAAIGAGAANLIASPAAGSIALTGGAPAVSDTSTAAPATGSIALTGGAPGVHETTIESPASDSITLTGGVPAVRAGLVETPAAGAIKYTGGAPVVTSLGTVSPSPGAIVLTGGAPSAHEAETFSPAPGSIVLTGGAPSAHEAATFSPASGLVALTGGAPSAHEAAIGTPTTGSIVLTGAAPTPKGNTHAAPAPGEIDLTGSLPPTVPEIVTPVFPFQPDWSNTFTVVRTFKTDIIASRSGKEQRRAVRNRARKQVQFTVTEFQDRARLFAQKMNRQIGTTIYLADYSRGATLTADLAMGGSTVAVDSTPAWMTGAVIFVSGSTVAVHQVGSASSLALTIADVSLADWPAGTRVYPGLLGRLDQASIQGARPSDNTIQIQVSFDVTPTSEPELTPPTAPTIFNDREVFLTKPDWNQTFGVNFQHAFETVDYDQGAVAYFEPIAYSALAQQLTFLEVTHAGMAAIEDVFDRAKGQRGEFYMPTWVNDLPPGGSTALGGFAFIVSGQDVFDAYAGDTVFKALMIVYADGSTQFLQVDTVTASGGDSLVTCAGGTFDQVVSAANVEMICWLPVCRFASDGMTTAWTTNTVANSQLNVLSLEALAPET